MTPSVYLLLSPWTAFICISTHFTYLLSLVIFLRIVVISSSVPIKVERLLIWSLNS